MDKVKTNLWRRTFDATMRKLLQRSERTFISTVTVSRIEQALVAAVKHMSNVTEVTIDGWYDPSARSFFTAAWKSFGANLKTLTLGGNLQSIKFLVLSLNSISLTVLEELSLDFTGFDPHFDEDDFFVLEQTIAPFVDSLAPQLRRLSISPWAGQPILSPLFANILSEFPLLSHFTMRGAPFQTFAQDRSAFTSFLKRQSATIRAVDLVFGPTYVPAYNIHERHAVEWMEEVGTDETILAGLETLQMCPTSLPEGFRAFLSFIQHSVNTLTSLAIRYRTLSHQEITEVVTIFSHHSLNPRLVSLRLDLSVLEPSLFDLLSFHLPGLRYLSLHLKGVNTLGMVGQSKPFLSVLFLPSIVIIYAGNDCLE